MEHVSMVNMLGQLTFNNGRLYFFQVHVEYLPKLSTYWATNQVSKDSNHAE